MAKILVVSFMFTIALVGYVPPDYSILASVTLLKFL